MRSGYRSRDAAYVFILERSAARPCHASHRPFGAAHYVSDYVDVAGIRLPTRHRIFPRNPDGQSLAEPLIVSIDLSEIAFT